SPTGLRSSLEARASGKLASVTDGSREWHEKCDRLPRRPSARLVASLRVRQPPSAGRSSIISRTARAGIRQARPSSWRQLCTVPSAPHLVRQPATETGRVGGLCLDQPTPLHGRVRFIAPL